jgi:hypothetical protein
MICRRLSRRGGICVRLAICASLPETLLLKAVRKDSRHLAYGSGCKDNLVSGSGRKDYSKTEAIV